MENLLRFSDNDVKDLFSHFMDRFHVRQFCSAHTTITKLQGCDNDVNNTMEYFDSDHDSMNMSICSTESSNSDMHVTSDTHGTLADKHVTSKCSFSVDEQIFCKLD